MGVREIIQPPKDFIKIGEEGSLNRYGSGGRIETCAKRSQGKSPLCTPINYLGNNCFPDPSRFESLLIKKPNPLGIGLMNGWGGRIRTYECQIQNLVTYRLSTPQ